MCQISQPPLCQFDMSSVESVDTSMYAWVDESVLLRFHIQSSDQSHHVYQSALMKLVIWFVSRYLQIIWDISINQLVMKRCPASDVDSQPSGLDVCHVDMKLKVSMSLEFNQHISMTSFGDGFVWLWLISQPSNTHLHPSTLHHHWLGYMLSCCMTSLKICSHLYQ